jgi:hypothetical protein
MPHENGEPEQDCPAGGVLSRPNKTFALFFSASLSVAVASFSTVNAADDKAADAQPAVHHRRHHARRRLSTPK